MSRPSVVILATVLGTLAVAVTPPAGDSASRPPWLDRAIAQTLAHDFPGIKPTRIDTIAYPRKVAVILSFARPVANASISPPSYEFPAPRFRVWCTGLNRPGHYSSSSAWHPCKTRRACTGSRNRSPLQAAQLALGALVGPWRTRSV